MKKVECKVVITWHILLYVQEAASNGNHNSTLYNLNSTLMNYRFGLILFHSEMGGTMFSVTSSSRILQRCS